jgi:AraC-like DNA-binding protein
VIIVVPDWRSGILIAFTCQALVLAAALWGTRSWQDNRLLALSLCTLAGMTAVYILGWRGHAEAPDWLAFLPVNLPLALGPLLYLHVRRVAGESLGRWRLDLAPAALQFAYLATLSLLPAGIAHPWKEGWHDHLVKPVVEIVVLFSLAGYAVRALAVLRRYRAALTRTRSDADLFDARWLAHLLYTLLATLACFAAVRFYTSFVGEMDAWPLMLWLGAWSCWLGVQGWRHATPALLRPQATEEPAAAARTEQDWPALAERWWARTKAEEWWREPDLTLASLAARLGTNTTYLSRAINIGLGINFNEMINAMRAEEVARRIDSTDVDADLLTIAFDAGFSSKATFNRSFRAAFGTSPGQYRRRLSP